jgi:hypothetical protein
MADESQRLRAIQGHFEWRHLDFDKIHLLW